MLATSVPQAAAIELLAAILPNHTSVSAAAAAAAVAAGAQAKDPLFYARWPYASPADILPYIEAVSQLLHCTNCSTGI
jgi:hypothetical protein